jgi:hypothetical protein
MITEFKAHDEGMVMETDTNGLGRSDFTMSYEGGSELFCMELNMDELLAIASLATAAAGWLLERETAKHKLEVAA